MNANEHQQNCLRTMAGFSTRTEQLAFGAALAAGEAGELLNLANKVHYQGHPLDDVKRTKIVEETGDSIWGICVALAALDIDFAGCIPNNSLSGWPTAPTRRLAWGASEAMVQAGRFLAVANGVYYRHCPVDEHINRELRNWATLAMRGLCTVLDVVNCTLDECLQANRDKLARRYEGRFSTARSIARVDVAPKVGEEVTRGTPVAATTFTQTRARGVRVLDDTAKAPAHS